MAESGSQVLVFPAFLRSAMPPEADIRLRSTKGAATDPKRTCTLYTARHASVLLGAVSDQNAVVKPAGDSVLADSQALQQAVKIQVCGCSSPTGSNRTRINVNTFLYRPSGRLQRGSLARGRCRRRHGFCRCLWRHTWPRRQNEAVFQDSPFH